MHLSRQARVFLLWWTCWHELTRQVQLILGIASSQVKVGGTHLGLRSALPPGLQRLRLDLCIVGLQAGTTFSQPNWGFALRRGSPRAGG